MSFSNAVKAFIIKEQKVLLVKRAENSPTRPGTWDLPGGRLRLGEDPFVGIRREVEEETNLLIEILAPIGVHNFTRDDNQKITMVVFLCRPKSFDVVLDADHTDYMWVETDRVFEHLHGGFENDVHIYNTYFRKSLRL